MPSEELPHAFDGCIPVLAHPDEVTARFGHEELRIGHAIGDELRMRERDVAVVTAVHHGERKGSGVFFGVGFNDGILCSHLP